MSDELRIKLNRIFLPDNTALYKFLLKNKLPLPKWLPKVLEWFFQFLLKIFFYIMNIFLQILNIYIKN